MIYYHGSNVLFDNLRMPVILKCGDFGSGVYFTDIKSRAVRVAIWKQGQNAYVYTYKVNLTEIKSLYNVKEFKTASVEWIKYVIRSRMGDTFADYDMVIGQTADVRTNFYINEFLRMYPNPTTSDYKKLVTLLTKPDFGTQICVKNENLLSLFNASKIKIERVK